MALPPIHPQPLVRLPEAFNDPAWLWELKLDGFRALAYLEDGQCRLISRTGHVYRSFELLRAGIVKELKVREAIFDGEIVFLDQEGRSLFNPLLFRRNLPVFAVFDVIWFNGQDLRELPLRERKQRLRRIVPTGSAHLLHVDWITEQGKELFQLACEKDLEGVVGKWAPGIYQTDGRATSWVKIKNPKYSQVEGRAGLFEGRRRAKRTRPPELVMR